MWLLIACSLLSGLFGIVTAARGTAGAAAVVGFGGLLAILARIAQASQR
jgi:hypothetical protein